MEKLVHPPSLEDIQTTHKAIQPFILRTPVFTSKHLNQICGASLFFKCENFQKTGSFKMRGAARGALALTEGELACGLATHSSGNHAQAVARAAMKLNTNAYIAMPSNAPASKREATASYGAEITLCAPNLEARESTLQHILDKTIAAFIHPYDNYNVIAGQGTTALELCQSIPDLEAIIAPVGGGGLLSGTCLTVRELQKNTKVYGAEPASVDDAKRSFDSGTVQINASTETIADGLKTNLSERTFGIISTHVEDILCVSEEEIKEAMKWVWTYLKIIIEPSSAVPVAAARKHTSLFHQKKVGIILSGGNVDFSEIPFI